MAIKDKKLFLFIFVTGFSGIVAQLLFLREMLVIYYGNEFTLGIILANWLISEALGSFYLGRKIKNYNLLIIFFILSLFFSFIILRNLKNILKLPFGQVIPLHLVFLSSLFILLPISISHGALFTNFAYHLSSFLKKGISLTYLYETLGTLFGGLFFTIFLIRYFTPLKIIALIIFLNLILLFLSFKKWWQLFPLLFFYLLFLYHLKKIEIVTIKSLWQNRNVISYHNSLYGNITILKDEEQHTLFHNGIPIIVSPIPFIQTSQDFIHLPLLLYQKINNKDLKILFISGGIGGNLNELKRYEGLEIDYLEIDPDIFKVLKELKSPLIEKELNIKGLRIYHLDARYFLKKINKEYDLIYLGLKAIPDLTLARLFTQEFFLLLKKRLKKDGFFVFSLPGSLTYLPKELRLISKTLLNTLKKVFNYSLIIPGEEDNIFISSDNEILNSQNLITIIIDGLKYLKDKNDLIINENYLKLRLKEDYFLFLSHQLANIKGKINTDFSPIALYYFLSYFNSHFSLFLSQFFLSLEKTRFSYLLSFLIIPFFFLFLKKNKKKSLAFLIFTTGFYTLLTSLIISFAFQIAYGYLYYQIGFLTTALMAGFALGSYFGKERKNNYLWLIILEIFLIIFSLFLIFQMKIVYHLSPLYFILISFITGFLGGAQFPLASELYEEKDKSKVAGTLYTCDLLGGFLSGIVGSSFLIPLWGIYQSLIFLIFLKITSGLALLFSQRI
jgi:spermidine synthase